MLVAVPATLAILAIMLWAVVDPPESATGAGSRTPAPVPIGAEELRPAPGVVEEPRPPVAARPPDAGTAAAQRNTTLPQEHRRLGTGERGDSPKWLPPRAPAEPERLEHCRTLGREREFVLAAACLEDYLADHPDETWLHLETGRALGRAGELAESDFHLERFLEYHPEHPFSPSIDRVLRWADEYFSEHPESTPPSRRPPDPKEPDRSPRTRCIHLYQTAYVLKFSKPDLALEKVREALGLCPDEAGAWIDRLEALRVKLEGQGNSGK